jgi:hypothetical protein
MGMGCINKSIWQAIENNQHNNINISVRQESRNSRCRYMAWRQLACAWRRNAKRSSCYQSYFLRYSDLEKCKVLKLLVVENLMQIQGYNGIQTLHTLTLSTQP